LIPYEDEYELVTSRDAMMAEACELLSRITGSMELLKAGER